MTLVKGGQGWTNREVKETGTVTGWLVLAVFALLTACAVGGELKNVKGPEVKTVDPQSVVSDETKLALPDEKEVKELAELFKKTQGKGISDMSAWNRYNELMNPLRNDPETWTDADYYARLKAARELMAVCRGVGRPVTMVGSVWPQYAANAKTVDLFVKRIKIVKIDWPNAAGAKDDDVYAPNMKRAIILYLQNNDDKLPTLEKKKAFIFWLKSQGVDSSVLTEAMKDLGK